MDWAFVGTCALIVCGRICDVTLDTVRTVAVIRGRKHLAVLVGFFEVLIWIFVVACCYPVCNWYGRIRTRSRSRLLSCL